MDRDWIYVVLALVGLAIFGWFCALLGALCAWLPFFVLGM